MERLDVVATRCSHVDSRSKRIVRVEPELSVRSGISPVRAGGHRSNKDHVDWAGKQRRRRVEAEELGAWKGLGLGQMPPSWSVSG